MEARNGLSQWLALGLSQWQSSQCGTSGGFGGRRASEATAAQGLVIFLGISQVVWWLRYCASTAGGMGLIPGWGTKILQAAWCSQINQSSSWTACNGEHWRQVGCQLSQARMNSAAADKQVLFLVRALLVSRNRHSSKLKTMVLKVWF